MKLRTFDPFYGGNPIKARRYLARAQVGMLDREENPGKMGIGIFAQHKLSHRSNFLEKPPSTISCVLSGCSYW